MMKTKYLLFVAAALSGCKAHQDSLEHFIERVHQEVQVEISQPEPIVAIEASRYTAHQFRHPFVLPITTHSKLTSQQQECHSAPTNRQLGHFSQFSLAKLNFKGVIGSENQVFVLVDAPNGHIAKLALGERLASSNAEIVKVTEHYLLVQEFISDEGSCWHQRDVKLQRQ
ncbi:pilus assembly protein PilP [Vibrio sp. M260118]|uniref:pilus assembly protein PilP n=1 Tax=Vibrio sp. M260118 TaxID=3020896 RepID=UPI002F40E468